MKGGRERWGKVEGGAGEAAWSRGHGGEREPGGSLLSPPHR